MAGTMVGILDGKVAIVTGAGRGLGRAMTLGLLDAGARVAAVELDAPAIEETQDAVEDRGAGERFLGIGADVTHDESGAKILRVTTERFGRLDILINNAGISTGLLRGEDQPVGKLWETTPEEFRRVIDVNLVAAFLMTRAVLPTLMAQRWGRIGDPSCSRMAAPKPPTKQFSPRWRKNSTAAASPPMYWCPAVPPTRGWSRGRWRQIARNSSRLKSWWRR